jgi:hypothetical protein
MVISKFQCRFSSFVKGGRPRGVRAVPMEGGYAVGKNGKCQSEGMSARVTLLPPPLVCRLLPVYCCRPLLPPPRHTIFVRWTTFLSTLSALLSALPWLSDHGVGWYPHYWDHKIEHGTYGTHGISAYGTYVVVCVPYAPRGSRTTRLPSLRLFRSLPPFCETPGTTPLCVRPLVLHVATTPSRSLSLPPDTFKSVPPAKNQKAKLLCLDRHANMPATRTRISH